jgi:uncharacterized protein YacL
MSKRQPARDFALSRGTAVSDPQNKQGHASPTDGDARQRAVLVKVVRGAFIVLLATTTLLNILQVGTAGASTVFELAAGWAIKVAIAAALGAVVIFVDVLTPKKKIATVSGVFLGIVTGIAATLALGVIIDLVAQTYEVTGPIVALFKVLVGISLTYLTTSIILQTQDEFRLVIPYVEFAKQIRGTRPLLLDSSALIDARFVGLAATGLVQSPVIIPRFVVNELQTLADDNDKLARTKGRRGLDAVSRLQRTARLDVAIEPASVPGTGVDHMLVELAKQMQGVVVTTDSGLARVAAIQSVPVINMNEIAVAMKSQALPGELISLVLVREGEQPGQAVGYLDDGTMIVVEDGTGEIGKQVGATVISTIQTSAGRLVFAKLARAGSEPAREPAPMGAQSSAESAPESVDVDAGLEGEEEDEARGSPAPERARGPFPPNPPRRGNRFRNPRR